MSKQPFVTGDVKPKEGLLFASLLLLGGLMSAWVIHVETFLLAIVLVVIGIIYSFTPRLKDKPFGDVLANAIAGGVLCYAMGWSVFRNLYSMPILQPVWLTLLLGATYLLTVIIDMEADKKAGLNTTAVYLGKKGTVHASSIIYFLSLAAYVMILIRGLSIAYLVLLPLLVRSPYTYYKLYKNPSRVYHVARRAVVSSFVGLILLLGIYTVLNVLGISGAL
jgi:4-hydroxybenzoate polyprenyltransferase